MVERQEKSKKLKKSRNTKTIKSPEQETRKDTQKQQILKAKKQETSSKWNYLWSLSAKYESSKKWPYAYNPNDNGHGPSYGTYQMNTRVGVYKAFIRRHGISPGRKWWNAAIKKYGAKRFRSMEHAFIKEKNYDPMMRRITIKNKSRFSNAMKQVIWSVAVQHGGGHKNLISIINRSWVIPGNTASEAQLIKSIYHQRSKIWPAGVKIRYTQERKTALALVKSGSSIA